MNSEKILLDHGSGGKMSHRLTSDIILPIFDNPMLSALNDGAVLNIDGRRLAFSTDSYTVDPLFFPGGNIGDLAVNGTVNDIAMCGATPLYLSAGLIIEEGFPMANLETIVQTMGNAAAQAGVQIVTGDTKVVPKGAADKIFINTSGVGLLPENVDIGGDKARIGDRVIISGSIADHGITVLSRREGIAINAPLESDSAPLNHMVQKMLATRLEVHVLRDPTRGGVATTLNEIAEKSDVGIKIYEKRLPIKNAVAGVCELLGFDPLYLANEGKLLAFVPADQADAMLAVIRADEFGKDACIIGEVVSDYPQKVFMQTRIGGNRIVDMLAGEQLPRIC